MEHAGTPKPDPIIINKITPVMPTQKISPIPTASEPLQLTTTEKLKDYIRKNKKLVTGITLLILSLCVVVTIILLTGSQSSPIQVNPVPVVSAPVTPVVSKPVVTPPTPPTVTSTTLQFTEDNVLNVNGKPYDTLSGNIIINNDITLVKPTNNKIVIKKGSSSFTITNFYEEKDHKLIDANFIGTTKSLGNTYRISQIGPDEGQVDYYYVQPNKIKLTGTCTPVSSVEVIDAPCGQANYQGYYFQCTGDLNFDFCDKIITDLDFSIKTN